MPEPSDTFPILDEELLHSLPKANKAQDLERMYRSPDSEDRVTWNMLRAIQRTPDDRWWSGIVAAARVDAGGSSRWEALDETPSVEFWRTVPSPPAYESASRRRMAGSSMAEWVDRASNARPVEGSTEVDVVFDADAYLVFAEAKLHADVSERTTYDPDRNQIARSIDCVLEQARGREAFFWMLVRDREPTRRYMQLIERYRRDPSELHRQLPHRSREDLERIVDDIAVVTWDDLLPLVPHADPIDHVREDLVRAVSAQGYAEDRHRAMWTGRVGAAAERALGSYRVGEPDDELAFLALTGKIEGSLRDRLAYELHRVVGEDGMLTVREWKKTDLAVMDSGRPAMLLEAKAFYTFDAVNPKTLAKYRSYMVSDIAKAQKLASADTDVLVLAVVTHVSSPVPNSLNEAIKYYPGINGALGQYAGDADCLRSDALNQVKSVLSDIAGPVNAHARRTGEAFGLQVTIDALCSLVHHRARG